MRCEFILPLFPRRALTSVQVIAEGIIKATKELQLTIPLIVRLQGTKEAEAKKMIRESGLKIFPFGESPIPRGRGLQLIPLFRWFGRGCGQGGRDGQVDGTTDVISDLMKLYTYDQWS